MRLSGGLRGEQARLGHDRHAACLSIPPEYAAHIPPNHTPLRTANHATAAPRGTAPSHMHGIRVLFSHSRVGTCAPTHEDKVLCVRQPGSRRAGRVNMCDSTESTDEQCRPFHAATKANSTGACSTTHTTAHAWALYPSFPYLVLPSHRLPSPPPHPTHLQLRECIIRAPLGRQTAGEAVGDD